MRRKERLLFGFVSLVIVTITSTFLRADEPNGKGGDYPNRAITIIVPWPAGGPSDTLSRIVASHMSRTLAQDVVVQNNAGSGGTIASLRAKQAVPDGYTLLTGNMGTHAAAVALYSKLPYDPSTDFEPIGIVVSAPIVILGRIDFPPNDLKKFVLYVKGKAQQLDEGHGGVASIPFTACLLLNQILRVKPRLVPYDGAAPAMEALIRGQVDYMCDQTITAAPQVRASRVKAYAVAAPERSPALPDVPTTKEGGLPEYQLSAWQAIFAPRGVPKIVVEKLNDALSRALDDETVRNRLLDLGSNIPDRQMRTPQALSNLVTNEVERWTSVVKAEGLEVRYKAKDFEGR
jgi:tripartite-type tricarboxylate transporter receptor subunit TctC